MTMPKKLALWVAAAVLSGAGVWGYYTWHRIFGANTDTGGVDAFVNIPTGSDFDTVAGLLDARGLLKSRDSFEWVALRMNYTGRVLPGRYRIGHGMSNKELVLMLRAGRQAPVDFVLNNVRRKEQLAGRAAAVLEADSAGLVALLRDGEYLGRFGFDTATCLALFIPNTYEFFWNTSADQFMRRMHREYKAFWNGRRTEQARRAALTPQQVAVLASIVEQETQRQDEKPLIAGVYINRFRKGWKLEADPTLVYALGDFSVQRVLARYKEIESPYNTYKYEGLPPGPICIPSIASIDAVLNYDDHPYMYFCAKHDFSGYHVFARSYAEHLENARRFHRELNKRNISS
jgi:UPF0755 protein